MLEYLREQFVLVCDVVDQTPLAYAGKLGDLLESCPAETVLSECGSHGSGFSPWPTSGIRDEGCVNIVHLTGLRALGNQLLHPFGTEGSCCREAAYRPSDHPKDR